jgi:diguanylate cyclase (GGDEF)-like protein
VKKREERQLREALGLAEELVSTVEIPALLRKILKTGVEISGAERGYIVLVQGPKIVFGASHAPGGDDEASTLVKISSTAVKEVIQSRKPLVASDASSDPRLGRAPSVAQLGIVSILCLPLLLRDRAVGALYLDHTRKENAFAGADLELLETLGHFAALAIENARLYEQTIHDSLTGLFSHRYFETALEREARKAARTGRPLSLLFVDLDHFKLVNDRHGHAAGDKVLRAVSALLKSSVRGSDVVAARYAGDEFEALLPETSKEAAREVAERILQGARALEVGPRKIAVTASIGLATLPDDAPDAAALARKADAAMYRAKRGGRNQICSFETPTAVVPNAKGFQDAEMDSMLRSSDALSVVGMLSRLIEYFEDPKSLLEQALQLMVRVTGAENGVVAVLDEGGGGAPRIVARHGSVDDPEVSRTISDKAMQSPSALLIADATRDARFEGSRTVAERAIRSLIASGIVSKEGKTLGAFYLENRTRPSSFTEEDRQLVEVFARKLAPGLLHALRYEAALQRIERLRETLHINLEELGFKFAYRQIVGASRPILELLRKVERAIEGEFPVIVEGETGVGKELIARVIHYNSARKEMPFVAENCGAIATTLMESELFGHRKGAFTGATADRKGLFQIANGGTLFLDEIESMPEEMQVKLLRTLETKEVRPVGGDRPQRADVRVLCSTNRDLRELVRARKFREDLFYRLNVFHLVVPPLRERKEDIPALVEHFLARAAEEGAKPVKRIEPALVDRFLAYDWPGNVRELENEIRRLVALAEGDSIPAAAWEPRSARSGGAAGGGGGSLVRPLLELEREAIEQTLHATGGNRARAAEVLGISLRALYYKIKEYGL